MMSMKRKLTPVPFVLTLALAACAQAAVKDATNIEEVPALSPKGVISLNYPNQWDINNLIALTQDGSRLIDASETARNIRVWDWDKKEVVQRLLLNEGTPERSDGKQHNGVLKHAGGGQDLALTPDGRKVAACVSISTETIKTGIKARVWNLENGAVEVSIPGLLRSVDGLAQHAFLVTVCDSISYSPDGKYMAISSGATLFSSEADIEAYEGI